jgi:4-deoxy-L-threo-5-hexosulose-uronate ketol-isomerase
MRYLPGPSETRRLDTDELRSAFLASDLFVEGEVTLTLTDLDRAVVGGAVPLSGALSLEAPPALRADYFTERREIGVLNIGGAGSVSVDGTTHPMSAKDVLYIGRGSRDVSFSSSDAAQPARFYLVSYPAHASFPTTLVRLAAAQANELGTAERANRRRIARYIHADGTKSAQLVMGVTTLHDGSVWNTMPAHTHSRRGEIYLYFGLPADAMVVHLMGEPQEIRSLIVRDGEAALSPGWSIHAGCGTTSYSFCWAMGGENQDYADMDPVGVETML